MSSLVRSRKAFSSAAVKGVSWGFVGLGQMGYPMARNLLSRLSASDELVVHDVRKDAAAQFLAESAETAHSAATVRAAGSVAELAQQAENIITVLPEPAHVRSVYADMLGSGPSAGRLFLDCSTIDLVTSAETAAAAERAGSRFVDAPMSGGVVGARAAALTFMIGCDPSLVARAEAVLLRMGKAVLHLGPQGSGLRGKLANNYLLALNNIAAAEALRMGVKWGLDPAALTQMINVSTGRCWPTEVNNPVPGVVGTAPASRGYAGGFGVTLANKDFKLARAAAEAAGVKSALGPAAEKLYAAIEADPEMRTKDFSVVYKYLVDQEEVD